MTVSTLKDDTQLLIPPQVVFGDIDHEIVAMNVESGCYLHLNSSGSFIFNLLDQSKPTTLETVYQQVNEEYEVEEATCHQEVITFVERCFDLGLMKALAS